MHHLFSRDGVATLGLHRSVGSRPPYVRSFSLPIAFAPSQARGIDLVGIDGLDAPHSTVEALASFDEIVSWYGANRPEFREAALLLNPNWRFLPALPSDETLHVTDFYAQAVGAPSGLRPSLCVPCAPKRSSVVIQPFSGSPRKNWPLDRFEELTQKLPLPVEWIAGPEENLPGARRFDNLWQLANWIGSASVVYRERFRHHASGSGHRCADDCSLWSN